MEIEAEADGKKSIGGNIFIFCQWRTLENTKKFCLKQESNSLTVYEQKLANFEKLSKLQGVRNLYVRFWCFELFSFA